MRAVLAAIQCEKRDLAANLAAHLSVLRAAATAGCRLVAFPEFSLTGSVDPTRRPQDAIAIHDAAIDALVDITGELRIAAAFGFSERSGDEFFITQAVARDGALVGVQRKRHLGDDELGYAVGSDALVFDLDGTWFGIVICAEANVDFTWDATVRAGAEIVLFCSAPGLYGRKTNDAEWRAGFEWWEGFGLGAARRHAQRLRVSVAMATQAGTTIDEDFPGIAALVDANGGVVKRLPDWRAATLTVDLPEAPA